MLRIAGNPKRLCDGLTRRDLLHIGAIGALSLGQWTRLRKLQAAVAPAEHRGGFGRAKSCILLFLFGSPSQHDTFDPKPEGPADFRGEFTAIPTKLPGVRFCETLPGFAGIADKLTVVRSMTSPHANHDVAYALTSNPLSEIPLQLNPRDPRHWPFIGSVVDYLGERAGRGGNDMPRNIALPYLLSSRRGHPSRDAGPYGHFLGANYDPVWTDFQGEGTEHYCYAPRTENVNRDPFAGVEPGFKLQLTAGEQRFDAHTTARLDDRRRLLEQLETARRSFDAGAAGSFDKRHQQAFDLLLSGKTRAALDLDREPTAMRDRYGMHLFGQASLAARRLIEAGGRFVTVFWDDFHHLQSAWDTHYNHFWKMRHLLCPGLDQTFVALVEDLESRGLLDETIVACISEHGRTPRITPTSKGPGRGHWADAYSAVFAGGGFARGKVVGATDSTGGRVAENPVSPKDILATIYHLLGIDPETTIPDRLGRPLAVGGEGRVRRELLG
ncbi:MAG: DUF1501 domain-containing protein [Planctomycetaceae bacterium]